MKLSRVVALASALLSLGWPAFAQTTPDPACVAREKTAAQQENADRDKVRAVVTRFNQGGFAALKASLPELDAALARAPAKAEERNCAGAILVRATSGSTAEALMLSLAGAKPGQATVVLPPSPYPTAALLLGSYNVESGRLPEALAYLERGLAVSPSDPKLASEAANTLAHLGRLEEALPTIDRALAGGPAMDALDRARLLRAKGFALGELKRYDAAEAAYKESLKVQPGHLGAQNELIYLARTKAGAAPTQAILLTSDKAATTSADDVLRSRMAQPPKP